MKKIALIISLLFCTNGFASDCTFEENKEKLKQCFLKFKKEEIPEFKRNIIKSDLFLYTKEEAKDKLCIKPYLQNGISQYGTIYKLDRDCLQEIHKKILDRDCLQVKSYTNCVQEIDENVKNGKGEKQLEEIEKIRKQIIEYLRDVNSYKYAKEVVLFEASLFSLEEYTDRLESNKLFATVRVRECDDNDVCRTYIKTALKNKTRELEIDCAFEQTQKDFENCFMEILQGVKNGNKKAIERHNKLKRNISSNPWSFLLTKEQYEAKFKDTMCIRPTGSIYYSPNYGFIYSLDLKCIKRNYLSAFFARGKKLENLLKLRTHIIDLSLDNRLKAFYIVVTIDKLMIELEKAEQELKKVAEKTEKLASEGDLKAKRKLADMYFYGMNKEANRTKALELYKEIGAYDAIGDMYFEGLGVEKSSIEAVKWYQRFVKENCPKDRHNGKICVAIKKKLGDIYFNGRGVEQDYKKAFDWYTQTANNYFRFGTEKIAYMYENGLGVEKNLEKAFKWYKKTAEEGNKKIDTARELYIGLLKKNAKYNPYEKTYQETENQIIATYKKLGDWYSEGIGTVKDETKANQWYKKAVKQIDENINVSCYIYQTISCLNEHRNYIDFLSARAEKGYETAQNTLGRLYLEQKNYAYAYKWLAISERNDELVEELADSMTKEEQAKAEDGLALLYKKLGDMYKNGTEVVEKDSQKAYRLYRKVIDTTYTNTREYSFSTVDIGLYHKIESVYEHLIDEKLKEHKELFDWILERAKSGDHIAQQIIGDMYFKGISDKADYIEAYKWSFLANQDRKENNLKESTFEKLQKILSQKQREEIEKQATQWLEKHKEEQNGKVH